MPKIQLDMNKVLMTTLNLLLLAPPAVSHAQVPVKQKISEKKQLDATPLVLQKNDRGMWFDGRFRTRDWIASRFQVGPDALIYGYREKVASPVLIIVERFGEYQSPVGEVHSYTVISPKLAPSAGGSPDNNSRGGYRVEQIHRAGSGLPAPKTFFVLKESYTRNQADQLVKSEFYSRRVLPSGKFVLCGLEGCAEGQAASASGVSAAQICKESAEQSRNIYKAICVLGCTLPPGAIGCYIGGVGAGAPSLGTFAAGGCLTLGGAAVVGGAAFASVICDPLVGSFFSPSAAEAKCMQSMSQPAGLSGEVNHGGQSYDQMESGQGCRSGYEKVWTKDSNGDFCYHYDLKDCGVVVTSTKPVCGKMTLGPITECEGCTNWSGPRRP